jgi:hypothetical protein
MSSQRSYLSRYCDGGTREFTAEELFSEVQDEYNDDESPKNNCVYVLLDSFIFTVNQTRLDRLGRLELFADAVLYVGSGGGNRPYSHLVEARRYFYETLHIAPELRPDPPSGNKIRMINQVWNEKRGIMPLIFYQNLRKKESLAFEQAVITAIGKDALTNVDDATRNWRMTPDERGLLGCYVLEKALDVFDAHGPYQPNSIGPHVLLRSDVGPVAEGSPSDVTTDASSADNGGAV